MKLIKYRKDHVIITFPVLSCNRCGHIWQPKKELVKICPRCKNKYFWLDQSPMGRPKIKK